ncbi:response regulator transcription factor [Clostridium transplantifaecale]|uniref:response regulator transcription factor n=1 Tax=Clostridium transplantifaecale TaxID=2479838 RepID=UPI000F63825D|nr:response regulator [Clostridium transplantifaecale]
MYKVIVAEDEDIIRKGLVYSVPWADMDCSVVGEARNGVEGVELIKRLEPDIVMADINMPVMDGLGMIRETYEDYNYSAIILSGYSNFEYARTAIRYGVTGYLLKPLKKEDLLEAVKDAKEKCLLRRTWCNRKQEQEKWKNIQLVSKEEISREDDAVVRDMLAFIARHYREKMVLQDVVDALNYSETFLNKKFKKQMGTTFIEYLNRYRIQKALELLKEGKTAVQDVSWMCGIGDYKYFNMVFKKYIGCSPKEYVSEIRERQE